MAMERELLEVIEQVARGETGGLLNQLHSAMRTLSTRWGTAAESTAPFWRRIVVSVGNPNSALGSGEFLGAGRSLTASVQGLGALGIAGVSIAVAVGVWVALGAGYLQGRQRARERGFMTGFSRGVVTGALNWKWPVVWDRFRVRRSYINYADPMAGKHEAVAENEGLFLGYCISSPLSEEKKKNFRKALRALAGRTDDGAWSQDRDIARNQQYDYVIALAVAGVQKGLIVTE